MTQIYNRIAYQEQTVYDPLQNGVSKQVVSHSFLQPVTLTLSALTATTE